MAVRNTVCVEKSNKVMDIKYKLKELKENRDKDELIYDYEILHDGDALVIKTTDKFRTGMQIFIKTIDNKIFTFEMQHSNKIREVKMKIQQKIKLSADQQNLYFQCEILNDDDKTIDEYQICDGAVIDIVAGLRGGIQIFAETFEGKLVTFVVQKSDKMRDLKNQIQKKTGLHPNEQILIYQCRILNDDEKTIDEYQICDNSVINVVAKLSHGGAHFHAKTIDGRTIKIGTYQSDKIINVKHENQDEIGLHADEQIWIYQDGIMENDKTIGEYELGCSSVINIVAGLK